MYRLILISAVALLGSLVQHHGSNAFAESSRKPNVIFILTDDLGWGDLGVFHQNKIENRPRHQTPQLDKMAAEGLQMRAHYCPAPVCAPSRATLLTGVHQGHATVRDNQFDKMLVDNHTLGTVMKQAGYTTALVGKYGLQGDGKNPQQWDGYPTKRGFDDFFGYVRHVDGHQHYPAHDWPIGNSPGHRSGQELWHNDQEISSQLDKCYTTDLFTARAKHWITEQTKNESAEPFFLYLAYDTPHAALQVPTVAYPDGQGVEGGLQWLGQPGQMINTAVGEIDSYRFPEYVDQGWSDVEERFATMVRRIDDCVGDLLMTLRDLGIEENTVVIFTSDNGPHHESYIANQNYEASSFQSYGVFDGTKRDTWEGGIRMPTLAWAPGLIPAGRVDQTPSQFHDWMPTLAELAGIAAPARTDGVSLLPTLLGQAGQRESLIYIEYSQNGRTKNYGDFEERKQGRRRGQMQVVHLDGYKGIRVDIQSHEDRFEIYDLAQDPKELTNLAKRDESFTQLEQRMREKVLRIRMRNDSAPRPYDDALVPAVEVATKNQGVEVASYGGPFSYVPSLGGQTPDKTFFADSIATALENASKSDAIEIKGWIDVPADGDYTFQITPSAPTFLRIHEAAVIDADFNFEAGQTSAGSIRLSQGLHPIRITMLGGEDLRLGLKWSVDDQPASEIPATAFYRP